MYLPVHPLTLSLSDCLRRLAFSCQCCLVSALSYLVTSSDRGRMLDTDANDILTWCLCVSFPTVGGPKICKFTITWYLWTVLQNLRAKLKCNSFLTVVGNFSAVSSCESRAHLKGSTIWSFPLFCSHKICLFLPTSFLIFLDSQSHTNCRELVYVVSILLLMAANLWEP